MGAGLLLAVGLACGALPQWPTEPPDGSGVKTTKKAKRDAEPTPETFECRDWSTLDRETLPALPQGRWIGTFEAAWATVLERYYDSTLGCLDWPALRLKYGEQVAEAETTTEAFDAMNAMLRELGQSHLAVIPPREDPDEHANFQPGRGIVPVRVRLLEGHPIITDAALYGARSGLPAGAELISVEGHMMDAEISRIRKAHDRPVEVAAHAAAAIQEWLTCPVGSARTVMLRPVQSAAPQRSVVACLEPPVERANMGNLVDLPIELRYGLVPGTHTGWIRFNLWLLPLVPRIEAAMRELRAQGMTSLIVDLRGNPGGVGAMVIPVARLLLAEDASLGELRTRDRAYTFRVQGNQDAFLGPIAVLLDEGSASTSEIFAQAFSDLERAQIVASGPSQGAALPSLVESLPGGARIQFVVGDYVSPDGVRIEGRGVPPHLQVRERPFDFAAGRDPVFEAAVLSLQTHRADASKNHVDPPPSP